MEKYPLPISEEIDKSLEDKNIPNKNNLCNTFQLNQSSLENNISESFIENYILYSIDIKLHVIY